MSTADCSHAHKNFPLERAQYYMSLTAWCERCQPSFGSDTHTHTHNSYSAHGWNVNDQLHICFETFCCFRSLEQMKKKVLFKRMNLKKKKKKYFVCENAVPNERIEKNLTIAWRTCFSTKSQSRLSNFYDTQF